MSLTPIKSLEELLKVTRASPVPVVVGINRLGFPGWADTLDTITRASKTYEEDPIDFAIVDSFEASDIIVHYALIAPCVVSFIRGRMYECIRGSGGKEVRVIIERALGVRTFDHSKV